MSVLALSLAALLLPAAMQTDRPSGGATGDEKANHNTARSNKSTIAAPDGPAVKTGDATANHNTARSSRNKGGRGPAPASGGTQPTTPAPESTSTPQ
ncbi:MAG: hypothetical protein KYX69_01735 [Sphingomonas sp.]|uniref:hypothetical protein n=1 Tax=Sphingomonas sp. TaxID=28214 RepID=UPI00262595A8|nr:hypothetical protein [Sphingomonas sp.]MDK2766417.1 hypothetical protein [Sphingomonas sp.]